MVGIRLHLKKNEKSSPFRFGGDVLRKTQHAQHNVQAFLQALQIPPQYIHLGPCGRSTADLQERENHLLRIGRQHVILSHAYQLLCRYDLRDHSIQLLEKASSTICALVQKALVEINLD
jgi:hypothetical protein